MHSTLLALSPLDGRYASVCQDLTGYFSEFALIRQRLRVEVAWLVYLIESQALPELPNVPAQALATLVAWAHNLTPEQAMNVKEIEAETRHDVKAVEYALRARLAEDPDLSPCQPWVHFGCTSEDINNVAYAQLIDQFLTKLALPKLTDLCQSLADLCQQYADTSMLSRTHGQPASPTTLGKEMAVFLERLMQQWPAPYPLHAKFSGAVGNFSAHHSAYPNIDWPALCTDFLTKQGLTPHGLTTQIEPHDSLAALMHAHIRIQQILLDLSRDCWHYTSLGYWVLKKAPGQVGSSTMPHKINPIDFENSEGNLGLATCLMEHLATKLTTSRLQRDLSDSTVLRNLGVAWGYQALALASLQQGLGKISANNERLEEDLDQHWEVLTEPVQTLLRTSQDPQAYETLKSFSQGKTVDAERLHALIETLTLPEDNRSRLLALKPRDYTGLARDLTEACLARWQAFNPRGQRCDNESL